MMNLTLEKCGCGKPIEYQVGWSEDHQPIFACNKHLRCMGYEDLQAALRHANRLIEAYREKRANDGLNGRTWNASKHFEAEALVELLEAPNEEAFEKAKLFIKAMWG